MPGGHVAIAREAFGGVVEHPGARRVRRSWCGPPRSSAAGKFTLAAWEVFECGKPWHEADGDVAEAIDFCEFYAREMIRLAGRLAPRRSGRDQRQRADRARGRRGDPALELPAGDPDRHDRRRAGDGQHGGPEAERAVADDGPAARRDRSARRAFPTGVLTVLPGLRRRRPGAGGRSPGRPDRLHRLARGRAGDQPPGRRAGRGQDHVKRVIAEMGGKNAIIIDDDADLDEAVVGVLQSAFGYAGQKCSACSRVIVLDGIHDAFLDPAGRGGPRPERRPGRGPGHRRRAGHRRPGAAADRGIHPDRRDRRARSCWRPTSVPLADAGQLRRPARSSPTSAPTPGSPRKRSSARSWRCSAPADLDEALAIANGTHYALTGGLYSRSPANIERVKREFRVGNLYINRPITGALVDRQPFGGFKLSGIGTKAGGPDYLKEFLLTRTVTENTMRRGFAPEEATERTSRDSSRSAGQIELAEIVAQREGEPGEQIAPVEGIRLRREPSIRSAVGENRDRSGHGVDQPDEADACREILLTLPSHFGRRVAAAQDLDGQVGREAGDRFSGERGGRGCGPRKRTRRQGYGPDRGTTASSRRRR